MINMIRLASGRALCAAFALFVLTLTLSGPAIAQERTYVFATATTGGTFYPVGVAIATVTKTRLAPEHGVSLSAISSAGSAENIKLMRSNEAQFAILQGVFSVWAAKGEGPETAQGPYEELRSISALWQNVEHFVARARFAQTGTMADMGSLKGRRFAIGKRNSGAEQTGRYILEQLGFAPSDYGLVYKGYGPSADALANGSVDGINTPAGVPVSAVTRAFAAQGRGLRLLSFTEAQLAQVNARYPLWSTVTLPAGTYPNQDAPVTSIQHPNILAVRSDVSQEDVYLIVKTMYENLGLLGSIHGAIKSMSLESALTGVGVPLHPGAVRYFREAGVTIPDELIVP